MNYNHIDNVKNYIKQLKEICGADSKWYNELDWFSSVNYNTSSEYYGELLLFVKNLLKDKDMEVFHVDLHNLYKTLSEYFN